MIRRVGGKWALFTSDGKRRLGTHGSRAEAPAQERAIQAAKGGKRPLRSQDIHHGAPAPQRGRLPRGAAIGSKRGNPGTRPLSELIEGNMDRPGPVPQRVPTPTQQASRPMRTEIRGSDLAGSWLREAPNPVVRKAGELTAGMFPARRTYLRFARAPQRGRRAEPPRKGWVATGRGTRVFIPTAEDFAVSGERTRPDVSGRTVIVKQGHRPNRIDYPMPLPTRHDLGREASAEQASNPPATRDPDPWRLPSAQPRSPSPLAGIGPDDARRSLRGVGRPLGDVHRTEAPAASRAADPAPYRNPAARHKAGLPDDLTSSGTISGGDPWE